MLLKQTGVLKTLRNFDRTVRMVLLFQHNSKFLLFIRYFNGNAEKLSSIRWSDQKLSDQKTCKQDLTKHLILTFEVWCVIALLSSGCFSWCSKNNKSSSCLALHNVFQNCKGLSTKTNSLWDVHGLNIHFLETNHNSSHNQSTVFPLVTGLLSSIAPAIPN